MRIVSRSDGEVLNEHIMGLYRNSTLSKCDTRRRSGLPGDCYKWGAYSQSTAKLDSPSDLKHTCPSMSALHTVSKRARSGVRQ